MADFERLPYPYPSDDAIETFAADIFESPTRPLSYTREQALVDAFVTLNMQSAMLYGFIEEYEYTGPAGRIKFRFAPEIKDNGRPNI